MSGFFRLEMIFIAIVFLMFVIRAVNKNYFLLKNASGWIFLAIGLLVIALFPNLIMSLSNLLGFVKTSNFLYFGAVMILLINIISNSVSSSQQQTQIKNLIQEISILKSLNKEDKNQ